MTTEPTIGDGVSPGPAAGLPLEPPPPETTQIARAAGVLALGNVISRVLGLARETVKSHFFGAGAAVDAYGVATLVPTMLYDLLIGGMVNGALVPVFSAYASKNRDELWRLVSALLNLTVVVLAVFVIGVELLAPQIAFFLLSGDYNPDTVELATRLLRITVPAVLFLSLSGVLSGLLYALKRFAYPAFTAAVFNAAIVAATLILHRQLSIAAMAAGLLAGSILQIVLQVPGLRDTGLRLGIRLWHPGMRKVALLYAPSLIPLLVDVLISRPISITLVSQTGEGGISYLNYATFLVQLPQGLVATAISLAVLPTLASHAANEESGEQFRRTLAQGLRLVIVLIVPATVGLLILAPPTVALLYEHGNFGAYDTLMTAWALRFYLLGLPFAAIDLLLVFSFYARQDTVTPALIGVGSIIAYLLLAAGLLPTWGLFSLMIADSFKHMLHTLLSSLILMHRIGGLRGHGVIRTIGLVTFTATVMGLVTVGALLGIETLLPAGGFLARVLSVAVPGLAGVTVYVGLGSRLGLSEIPLLVGTVRKRLFS